MKKIESGKFAPRDIDVFQELQWAYAKRMVNKPLKESFLVEELRDFKWPNPLCPDLGKRRDNDYKSIPER